MDYLFALALIAAGLLGASGLIVAKKPNAANIINSLMAVQAIIGRDHARARHHLAASLGPKSLLDITKAFPFMGAARLGAS